MGEAIHVRCLECKKDYGLKFTGRGIQTVHNFLPGYCSSCRIVITSKAENPICNKCKGPVTLCGRFLIETKDQWIKRHRGAYKYDYSWDLLKNKNLPASLNSAEEVLKLNSFNNLFNSDTRLQKYYLSFEIDLKTKYECKECNTQNVKLGFGGLDWD